MKFPSLTLLLETAGTTAPPSAVNDGVTRRIWVAVNALRLAVVNRLRCYRTAKQVIPTRNDFQMGWINAVPIAAEMIKFQIPITSPQWKFVVFGERVPMGEDLTALATDDGVKTPVSVGRFVAKPEPANISLLDFVPKPSLMKRHSLKPTGFKWHMARENSNS